MIADLRQFRLTGQCLFRLLPPFRPPFLELDLLVFLPRPLPLFFPPPLDLLTVAQARALAVLLLVPRFLYPCAMCSAFRFCFDVYFFLLPCAISLLHSKNATRTQLGFIAFNAMLIHAA